MNAAPTGLPSPGCRSGNPTAVRIPSSAEVQCNWSMASLSIHDCGDAMSRTDDSMVVVMMLKRVDFGTALHDLSGLFAAASRGCFEKILWRWEETLTCRASIAREECLHQSPAKVSRARPTGCGPAAM